MALGVRTVHVFPWERKLKERKVQPKIEPGYDQQERGSEPRGRSRLQTWPRPPPCQERRQRDRYNEKHQNAYRRTNGGRFDNHLAKGFARDGNRRDGQE